MVTKKSTIEYVLGSILLIIATATMSCKEKHSEQITTETIEETPDVVVNDSINAVLRTASIYVKDWDASLKFYTEYLGYKILVQQPINSEKSLKTIGAGEGVKARIAYLKPNNSRIGRPFAGNYISLIEFSGSGFDGAAYKRSEGTVSAVMGEVTLAHQVVAIDRIYETMKADGITIIAELSLSGAGLSRSFSALDPNGIRVEMYEFLPGKEPIENP